jgi:FtsH-binding integral membrane protein
MSQPTNPYQTWGTVAANAEVDERASFIRLTYLHLAGAVLAFLGLEAVLLSLPQTPALVQSMVAGRYSWLIVMGAFMGASYLAQYWAQSSTSKSTQYLGLGLYVVAEALIFVPIMFFATKFGAPNVVPIAGFITLFIFGGLTGIVMLSGADFSFLGTGLKLAGLALMAVIVGSLLFGFNLGLLFVAATIFLAAGYILYDTSNVMHHYRVDQHVAASLALFASVALLFFYILRLVLMLTSSRD